ncbi:glycosyltransferase [Siccirubricoccus sp. G192]|uniref:glycosyltransferase n=1 Tax=Siccirubricoccus sp. G192 TaxID=2849651 RepID=UPI001C2B7A7E|nr:glycosyltransferase [Siccirubricoccus sp. G192]MBV1796873.1 glycosyltransferase [Siccirubricoccus sp. G192]
MAYARHWIARPASACTFVAQSAWGWFAALPRGRVAALLDALEAAWQGAPPAASHPGGAGPQRVARRLALGLQAGLACGAGRAALRAALAKGLANARRPVFLLVSHRALDHGRPIAALRRAGAAFVPFVHDLIPLTHPEYARPAQVGRHARRIATIAEQADGVIVNSAATAATLLPHLARHGAAAPPLAVAPLGIEPWRASPFSLPTEPYFVCLGTIEPRKNHLLLLHLWRDLAARLGPAAPRLLLLGRRGWENENILDLLDRCGALGGLVREIGTAGDREVTALLAGARALLFPSFAEGYGLPLAEALALGVPAICSDLPALREVGGAVPDYLDPLDGPAWRRAILDYATPASAARAAQLARLGAWQKPAWAEHFAEVEALLQAVVAVPARAGAPAPGRIPSPLMQPAPLGAVTLDTTAA